MNLRSALLPGGSAEGTPSFDEFRKSIDPAWLQPKTGRIPQPERH